MSEREYILTLACPDSRGIVAAVANLLSDHGCNITESQQYGDHYTGRFFLRMQFVAEAGGRGVVGEDDLRGAFAALAGDFGGAGGTSVEWTLSPRDVRPRMIVMVSKFGHCLNDLLYRHRSGLLDIDIAAVVSNHPDLEFLADSYGVDFHHLPVTPQTKGEQEARLLELVGSYDVDLVVLARYMQVLSEKLCTKMSGRIINIHHSFLPSFKGARPYHQAHARGVKLIGATAHYVTADLDEGPIIEQEVARVDHTDSPEKLTEIGRDLESVALARAVNWHAQRRVLLNGDKTVVFG
ncbi:formyltetrahydrofolate deformylase [Nocardiopsis changdeensis]|uniref:Formyltetrahydrofolate deformylase n=1 Tax=Nocardiopsis changdeensis TaxID=2831969 RepID=A0ABX8BHI3_9ACTN|nr:MULTISPECIES: formyltetrahydrofolate deformylase [Nocardiopsis]QUX21692.1 formyltetrahydrofolate deformylase [Nocardiopsis changdeensis]QYX37626.1 formyltetrahydrofolate deformylase [Nocardiopsis sp. MT53]